MENILFITVLSIIFVPFLWWSFVQLPLEKWQIIASVPVRKTDNGSWNGINYTYYGFFVASAQSFAVIMMLVLTMSIGMSPGTVFLSIVGILAACIPSSRFVALLFEKRAHTFTVAGASFVGLICTPFLLLLMNAGGFFFVPIMPFLAAVSIAYAFGEGIGRIACISFGCCFGKSVHDMGRTGRRLFRRMNFVFGGQTKKVAYEGGLENCEVVPVQAITSVIYIATGIGATCLFLASFYRLSFLLAIIVTQLWRCYSETLRADYRGGTSISPYQIMALLSIFCVAVTAYIFGPYQGSELPQITRGLKGLASPLVIFFIQGVWLVVFLYFGKSSVTGADISFHLNSIQIEENE